MIGLRRSFFATSSNPLLRDLYLLGKKYDGYFGDDLNFFVTNAPIDIAQTYNISGFTNSADNYSWLFQGYFIPATTETYTFYTNSDDASYLWIGVNASGSSFTGNALVNNGGLHSLQEKSGSVALQANTLYPIKIAFGESVGDDTLTVSFSTPTINKTTNGFNLYRGGQYAWNNWPPLAVYSFSLGYSLYDSYGSCFAERFTRYSSTAILEVGVVLYSDLELSSPLTEGRYSDGTTVYTVDDSGTITDVNGDGCAAPASFSLGNGGSFEVSCNASRNTYYSQDVVLAPGSVLYQNIELTNPAESSFYSDGLNVFTVGGNGIVTNVSINACFI